VEAPKFPNLVEAPVQWHTLHMPKSGPDSMVSAKGRPPAELINKIKICYTTLAKEPSIYDVHKEIKFFTPFLPVHMRLTLSLPIVDTGFHMPST